MERSLRAVFVCGSPRVEFGQPAELRNRVAVEFAGLFLTGDVLFRHQMRVLVTPSLNVAQRTREKRGNGLGRMKLGNPIQDSFFIARGLQ